MKPVVSSIMEEAAALVNEARVVGDADYATLSVFENGRYDAFVKTCGGFESAGCGEAPTVEYGVTFGTVGTFYEADADKKQAVKVIEEAAELFSAWEDWNAVRDQESIDRLCEEAADVVQAVANMLAALGINEMRDDMRDCRARNEERGRIYR